MCACVRLSLLISPSRGCVVLYDEWNECSKGRTRNVISSN